MTPCGRRRVLSTSRRGKPSHIAIGSRGIPATQDHATLVLKGGQVDAAGIQASNPFQLAVTGGTGRFQNARGQATVRLWPGKGNRAQITLSLLP